MKIFLQIAMLVFMNSSQAYLNDSYTVTCNYPDGSGWSAKNKTNEQADNLVHTCELFGGTAKKVSTELQDPEGQI